MTGPPGLPYSTPTDQVRYRCPDCGYTEIGRPEWRWTCPKGCQDDQ